MARQTVVFGFPYSSEVNETGTRQVVLPDTELNETVSGGGGGGIGGAIQSLILRRRRR